MKIKLEGAQRACTPAETIARMKPWWPQAGITRVSLLTGLDRCGIPVAQCVRPDAMLLSVDSGKGATAEAAMCSAMMEGFERHVGESAEVEVLTEAAIRLASTEVRFQLIEGAFHNPYNLTDWTNMFGIQTNEEKLVPVNCVKTKPSNFELPFFKSEFASCTNGLSSGNTLEEAAAGGLYEVIERDQVSNCMSSENDKVVVDLNTIQDSTLGNLVERLKSNDVYPVLFDCTLDIGVPTYTCYIYDFERNTGIYKGYATHLNPEVAQCRAVCEAVQARVGFMSGSRDDIYHKIFFQNKVNDNQHSLSELTSFKNTVSSRHHNDLSTDCFIKDISVILSKLNNLNLPEPLIKVFKHPYPCSVVKIAIPTLAGYLHKGYKSGRTV